MSPVNKHNVFIQTLHPSRIWSFTFVHIDTALPAYTGGVNQFLTLLVPSITACNLEIPSSLSGRLWSQIHTLLRLLISWQYPVPTLLVTLTNYRLSGFCFTGSLRALLPLLANKTNNLPIPTLSSTPTSAIPSPNVTGREYTIYFCYTVVIYLVPFSTANVTRMSSNTPLTWTTTQTAT